VVASVDEGGSATKPSPVSTRPTDGSGAKILGHLPSGQTYGIWREDTPDSKRPDFMRVKVDGNAVGYLKVEEVWPAIDPAMFESSDAGRKLRAKYTQEQIQPNDKGEVWAPAYGSDGKTEIGKVLVYTVNDEPIE
jgi:hypothetical protein